MPLKIFITFLFVSFFITIQAQIANWQWAKSIVGGLEPMAVSVDSNGNTFVTGYFQSPTITLGNITLTNVNNSPDQTWDFFIAKYDTAGNVIWAKSAGGSSFDQGRSLSADAAGNVFVTGWFGGTIVFGTTTLSSVGGNSTFLVKYDALGNVLWAKDVSGRPTTICIDNTGNAYLSGEFSTATCTFGSTVLTNTDPSGQSRDIFIAKYDSAGNVLWAKSLGGSGSDEPSSICADASGNLLLTGYFASPSITFGATTLTHTGSQSYYENIFVAKYDANGNALWALSASGVFGNDYGKSIATDGAGNVLVTGYFASPTLSFGNITLTNSGNGVFANLFILKCNASGTILWAKSIVTQCSPKYLAGICTNAGDHIFVTGTYGASTIAIGNNVLTNAGKNDGFVAEYDASGNGLWAKSFGGTESDYANSIGIDAGGRLYIVGSFRSTNFSLGNTTLININSPNSLNGIVAKLDGITTGNANRATKGAINLYPNPFSKETVLKSEVNLENASLRICNSIGEVMKEQVEIYGATIAISCDELLEGVYFILLMQNGKVIATKKVVIVK